MNESTLVPREEMSDLDWLARNVHEWPENGNNMRGGFIAGSQYYGPCCSEIVWCKGGITKRQWLARRAELQNKPSWNDAPEWANWLWQSHHGDWWWHENEPSHGDVTYLSSSGKFMSQCVGEVLGDWRDTLEKRPEQDEFEPFVSVEDVKFSMLQSDDSAKDSGGFIDRFILVKEDAATAKQHDPVNSPSHYASGGIECIDAIKASMSREAFLGYLKGNVQKYMWRYEKKVNPSEDLKKARWYLDKLIEEQK